MPGGEEAHREGMTTIVELDRVGKIYRGGTAAIEDLSLTVGAGEVYGLVGLNGAGKTTVLGIVTGLLRATSGSATTFGAPPGSPDMLARTGTLLESCGLYPHLTGRQNLRLLARVKGVARQEVDRTLESVGLAAAADRRYRTYSQGMKQRLGVAAALLAAPTLLVLDEPTNGLDPAGIADLRHLVRDHARAGGAVLLSSHLLGELEQVCDRIGVIRSGRLVAQVSPQSLGAGGPTVIVLRCDQTSVAVSVLQDDPAVATVAVDGPVLRIGVRGGTEPRSAAAALNRRLVSAGLAVSELSTEHHTLEAAFFALTDQQAGERIERADGAELADERMLPA